MIKNNFINNGRLKDYYQILQVDRNASPEIIAAAYKSLSKKYHPDVGGSAVDMVKINEAYNVLKNQKLRSEYDIFCERFLKLHDSKSNADAQKAKSNFSFTEKNIEKIIKANFSNHFYEVRLKAKNFIIPNLCVCCLSKPTEKIQLQYSWTEHNLMSRTNKSITINFPLCENCRKHKEELENKTLLFTFLFLIPSIFSAIAIIIFIPNIKWFVLWLFGAIIAWFTIFIGDKFLKIRNIKNEHADYGDAVWISHYDESDIVLAFYNLGFAELFSQANAAQIQLQKGEKYTHSPTLYKGKLGTQIKIWTLVLTSVANLALYKIHATYFSAPVSVIPQAEPISTKVTAAIEYAESYIKENGLTGEKLELFFSALQDESFMNKRGKEPLSNTQIEILRSHLSNEARVDEIKDPKTYVSLPNGTSLSKNSYYFQGLGKLKIDNGTSLDAIAKLVNITTNKSVLTVYIKANSIYEINKISDGNYKLFFNLGNDWDAEFKAFAVNSSYEVFEENFDFTTSKYTEGDYINTQYATFSVTLNPVIGGQARTDTIDAVEFGSY